MKSTFSLKYFISVLLITSGILYSQSNYSQSTIDELNTLNGNVKKAITDNDSLSIARAYYKLAIKYDYLGEKDSCNLYYRSALSIANTLNNSKAIAVISNSFATTFSDKGLHSKAIKIYSEVVERFLSLSDTSIAADVMVNISMEYVDIGKYEKALVIALDALNLKLAVSDSIRIAAYYQQIGIVFNAIGNKQKWKEYILIADSLSKTDEKYSDFYIRMDILNELGAYYLSENNYDKAKSCYDTLYTQSKKNDYLTGITKSLTNLVPLLEKEQKYSQALELSYKALELSEKVNFVYRIITNLIQIAKLEITISKSNLAESKLLRARDLAIEFNFPNELATAYSLLSEINLESKNYKKAHYYFVESHTLKDSIEGGNTKQIIAELETKYQTEKKDNQIEILNKENLIQEEKIQFQNRTVIGLILLGVFVIAIFILLYTQIKLKSENRVLNMHHKLLRSQMNPHFIFNALIAIQNYILKNKKFEASDYLSKFASLMRSILEGSRDDFILLSRELELLEYYVSLQQLRFENSFQFTLEVDESIDTECFQIPPMLIQPFIENAIEHGLRKTCDENKALSVKYNKDSSNLYIIIKDNGIGIEKGKENKIKKHQSYAMIITNERLTNITKIYKENINISIQDLSTIKNCSGTEIKFSIPLSLISRNKND